MQDSFDSVFFFRNDDCHSTRPHFLSYALIYAEIERNAPGIVKGKKKTHFPENAYIASHFGSNQASRRHSFVAPFSRCDDSCCSFRAVMRVVVVNVLNSYYYSPNCAIICAVRGNNNANSQSNNTPWSSHTGRKREKTIAIAFPPPHWAIAGERQRERERETIGSTWDVELKKNPSDQRSLVMTAIMMTPIMMTLIMMTSTLSNQTCQSNMPMNLTVHLTVNHDSSISHVSHDSWDADWSCPSSTVDLNFSLHFSCRRLRTPFADLGPTLSGWYRRTPDTLASDSFWLISPPDDIDGHPFGMISSTFKDRKYLIINIYWSWAFGKLLIINLYIIMNNE